MVQEEESAEFQVHFGKLVPWIRATANANTYSRIREAQQRSEAPGAETRKPQTSNFCKGSDGGSSLKM